MQKANPLSPLFDRRFFATLAGYRPLTMPTAPDHRAALLAGFLGWMLDAFDFFLVIFCLTAIGKDFHKSDAQIALSITITLAFRPLGPLIFVLLAHRYARLP